MPKDHDTAMEAGPLINERILSTLKSKPEYFNLRFFNWRVYTHPGSGVQWADGRSGNSGVKLGRYSLGSTDREAWLEALHTLDLTMAIANGRARADQLQGADVPQLQLQAGLDIYERHCDRPEVVGGGLAKKTPERYLQILKKLILYARSQGVVTWNGIDKRLLQDYANHLEQNGLMYSTQYMELTVILQTMKHLIEEAKVLPSSARIHMYMPRRMAIRPTAVRPKKSWP